MFFVPVQIPVWISFGSVTTYTRYSLLFLKGKSASLPGEPGDDDCTPRGGPFPLLCDLKLDSIAGSVGDAHAVEEGSVYCDDAAPENG